MKHTKMENSEVAKRNSQYQLSDEMEEIDWGSPDLLLETVPGDRFAPESRKAVLNHRPCASVELESDSVLPFLVEYYYQKDETDYIGLDEVFAQYVAFCKANCYWAFSRLEFIKRLEEEDIKVIMHDIRCFVYLKQVN